MLLILFNLTNNLLKQERSSKQFINDQENVKKYLIDNNYKYNETSLSNKIAGSVLR